MTHEGYVTTFRNSGSELTRTVTFLRNEYDVEGDFEVEGAIRSISIEQDSSEDCFKPIRETTGKISFVNNGKILRSNLFSSTADGVSVWISNDNGVIEFVGYVSQEDYEYQIQGFGDFDVSIIDRLSIAKSTAYWSILPKWAGSREAVDAGGYQTLQEVLNQCKSRLHLTYVCFPELFNDTANLLKSIKIPVYLTMDNNESDNGEDDFQYWESKTVENILEQIAKLFGVSFIQRGSTLYAEFPGCETYFRFSSSSGTVTQTTVSEYDFSVVTRYASSTQSIYHGARKVKITHQRDTFNDILSGTQQDSWKWSSYAGKGILYGNDANYYQDIYFVSGNDVCYCKDNQSKFTTFGGNTLLRYNGLTMLKKGALWTHLVSEDGENEMSGFLINLYAGNVATSDSLGYINKDNKVIMLRSKGCVIARDGKFRLKLKAFGMMYANRYTSKRNLYSLNGGSTKIYVTLKIGDTAIADTKELTYIVKENESGDLGWVSVDEEFTVDPGIYNNINGVVTLELSVGSSTTSAPTCFVFISDIDLTFKNTSRRRQLSDGASDVMHIDPFDDPDEYIYSKRGDCIGDEYDVECDWNENLKTAAPDRNTLVGISDLVAIGGTESESLGKIVCRNISNFLLENRTLIKFKFRLGELSSDIPCGIVNIDNEKMYIHSFSRDYGSDTDTMVVGMI